MATEQHPFPGADEPIRLYKYQIPPNEDFWVFETDYRGPAVSFPAEKPWISLMKDGTMWIRGGYSWDGATLFPDFPWIKIASLPHDAGYQLLREGVVDPKYRAAFDSTLRKGCERSGSGKLWAWIVWAGVRIFGAIFGSATNV